MMMNEDSGGYTPDPYTVREPEAQVTINAIPNRGLKVMAASLSLLQPDDKAALADYSDTMGREPSLVPKTLQAKIQLSNKKINEVYSKALMPLLGDINVPFEQKEAAVAAQRQGANNLDVTAALTNEALIAQSGSETPLGEAVRMKLHDGIDSVNAGYREMQSIENGVRSAQNKTSNKVLEIMDLFVPLEANLMAGKVANKLYGDKSITAAAVLLPGTARRQQFDAIANMKIEDRVEFIKQLAPIVAESSGILTDQNSLQTSAWVNDFINGNVSKTDEWIENVFGLLDMTGVGKLITTGPRIARDLGKAAKKLGKAAANAETEALSKYNSRIEPTLSGEKLPPAPAIPGVNGEAKITGTPTVASNLDKLEAAESARATALGETSRRLEDGQVVSLNKELTALQKSWKEGGLTGPRLREPGAATAAVEHRQNIQSQITRVEEQLASNAAATKAEGHIAELDKEIAQLKKDITTRPIELSPIAATIRRVEMNSVIGFSNPHSAATIFDNANPAKAKSLHAQVYFQSDEFAEAITGGPKNEALIRGVTPQVAEPSGVVTKVVDDKEETLRQVFTRELNEAVRNSFGGYAFTEKELAGARAAKQEDYSTVSGMKINDGMSSFGIDSSGTKLEVNAVYTNGEGGWLQAQDAITQAKTSLRKQGVMDADIEVLRRDGGTYTPVKLEEVVGKEGDYVVRVKLLDDITANDIKEWDNLDVKRNFFDYFEGKGENTWGSINRHVIDAAGTLHKQITGSMTLADDKAARLSAAFTEMFEQSFSTPYQALTKARRQAVDAYIKEANIKEWKFDRAALQTRFNTKELDVLQGWRDSWDIMWEFENLDLVKTLRRDKFTLLDHPNMRAVVRERPKRYDNRTAYDPRTDTVVKLTDVEIDDLYKTGGNVAEFRRPIDVAGQEVEFAVIRNQGNETARTFRDSDKMLEHRDGYYQVFYKHPQFIEETLAGGKSRVINVVGNIRDANDLVNSLSKQFPGRKYIRRGDDRSIDRAKDAYWDMQHVGGRLAQRHRGEMLENSIGLKSMGELDFLETPADSAVRASQSIGGRLAMRDTLDIAKQRFLSQYDDVLLSRDAGRAVFPHDRGMIGKKGVITNSQIADARTTWEYIRSIENGYINAMDNTVKVAFNFLAETAGNKGYDTVEKLARAGQDTNITGSIKGAVFGAMIATNPLRQFIVQPNQSLRMLAYNPSGFLSGRVPGMLTELLAHRLSGAPLTKATDGFQTWLRETGVEQAIVRGNLIRGTLLDAAERSTTLGKVKDATIGNIRKVGYDKAEQMNLAIHGAFIFDKFKQGGKDILNKRVREEMHAELRHITGNMNLAGDMPYNQNALALVMTYMQVPHKFVLMPFNRHLPLETRMKLLAADLTIWGTPAYLIAEAAGVDLPIENEWMREFLEDGLQSVVVNGMASMMLGEKQRVDMSSLKPFGLESWTKLANHVMFDEALKGVFSNTPTARVLGLGADSRLGMALQTTSSYYKNITQVEHNEVDLIDVANSWASMSSGWSNFQKARAAWGLGKVRDQLGRITDDSTSKFEAAMIALGLPTQDTSDFYNTMKLSTKKDIEDQAKSDVEAKARMITLATNGDPTSEKSIRMWTQLLATTGTMPDKEVHRQYMHRLREGWEGQADDRIKRKLFDNILNIPRPDLLTDPIKNSTMSPEDKQKFLEIYAKQRDHITRFQKEAEEAMKDNK